MERLLRWGLCITAALIALQLFTQALLALHGSMSPVAPVYFAMGHGILNGLIPYRDLFETKPPGIFLLSALSLQFFGDERLGNILHALLLFGIPLLFAFSIANKRSKEILMLCFSLAGILMLYTSIKAGVWQTEFFGAAAGIAYICAIRDREKISAENVVLATASMTLAIGFKEPFFLSLAAASLLLLRTWRSFLRGFVLPAIITAVIGMIGLWFLGSLHGYLSLYLPEMFGHYVQRFSFPWWERGVAVMPIARQLFSFSIALPLLLCSLIGVGFCLEQKKNKSLSLQKIIVIIVLLHCAFAVLTFPDNPILGITAHFLFEQFPILTLSLFLFFLGLTFTQASFKYLWPILRWFIAIYISIYSISIGNDFQDHHFIVAVPFYAAIILLMIQSLTKDKKQREKLIISGIAVLVLLTVILSPTLFPWSTGYQTQIAAIRADTDRWQTVATDIDVILDACHVDRYLPVGQETYDGFTRHSPLTFFVWAGFNPAWILHNPAILQKTEDAINTAQIVVLSGDSYDPTSRLGKEVRDRIDADFTTTPWACAAQLKAPEGYTIIYEKNKRDQ